MRVIEGADVLGGGTRTAELTRPGFRHDVCSAVHPMGVLSPFWRTLPLHDHGLEWIFPEHSVAHPLDGGRAVVLTESVEETAAQLGADERAWRRMVEPFLRGDPHRLLADLMAPLGAPRRPFTMARFGASGALPASLLASLRFDTVEAKALFAGLAGHSILPFDAPLSGAVGLVFALTGHLSAWPVARGGSDAIANALAGVLREAGGELQTGTWVRSLDDLPESRVVLFDTSPGPMAEICGDALPAGFARALRRYEYGPGTFKLDFALDGPIPWQAEQCHAASTVHVGGTIGEIAVSEKRAWQGKQPRNPYLIVCQQSHFDPSRAPDGKHTGYAYCHVPNGWDGDATEEIVAQLERFAPGFRDRILEVSSWSTRRFEAHNPNYVGGAITGGAATWRQLFTRPTLRANPYTTPNPRLFLCSASTPPGGGVHGMCGYYAARAALRALGKQPPRLTGRRGEGLLPGA